MTAEPLLPQNPVVDITEDPIVLGLKQLYDSVLEEAIPEDFMGFLTQIDAARVGRPDCSAAPPVTVSNALGSENGQ